MSKVRGKVFPSQSWSLERGTRASATQTVCQTEIGVSPGGDIHFLEQQHNQEPFQFAEGLAYGGTLPPEPVTG